MDIQSSYYEAGIVLFWLLFAYLFMDKFVFRGQLGEICFGKARRRMAKALRGIAGWFDPVKEEQKKGRRRTKGKAEKKDLPDTHTEVKNEEKAEKVMATTFDIQLPHYSRGFHLITRDIVSQLPALPESGLLVVFIKHTSAGLTINENADPDVRHDFQTFFNKLVPDGAPYFIHTLEGPDDMSAHIKASLVGSSVTIPIKNHRLNLGTWQGVYLCEFRDGGDTRKLSITIL